MANPHKYYYYGIRVHGIYSVSCFGPLAAGSKNFQLGVWYESISNWLLLNINDNNNFQITNWYPNMNDYVDVRYVT